MIFWKRVKQAINDKWYPLTVTVGKPVETQELIVHCQLSIVNSFPGRHKKT